MKITNKLKRDYLKSKLSSTPVWALRALMIVYGNQTPDEKCCDRTAHQNNVGFTGTDANFLSSLSRQYKNRGGLTPNQMVYVLKRMPKYWKQILVKTNEKKLIDCMFKDGVLTSEDVIEYEKQLFLKGLES